MVVFNVLVIVLLGLVAQWVMCLATDASLTADPGGVSLIPAQSYTFVEIDYDYNFYGHSPPFC